MYGVVLMVAVASGGSAANFDHLGGCYGGLGGYSGLGGCYGSSLPIIIGGHHGHHGHHAWNGCHGGIDLGAIGGGEIVIDGGLGLDFGYGCFGGHHGHHGHHHGLHHHGWHGCHGDLWGGHGCCGGHHHGHHEKGKKDEDKDKKDKGKKDKGKKDVDETDETATESSDAPARLEVSLPANATLKIDGAATRATGARRTFVTPNLPAGKDLKYTLQIEARDKDGKTVSWTQKASVRAGETTRITLTPPTTVASR